MKNTDAITRSDSEMERLEILLKIDKHALDDELMDQPHNFNQVSQRLADAISYRDEAKDDFDGTKALLDQQLRQQMTEAGEKFTEDKLKALIVGHPEYQHKQIMLRTWNDRVNRWTGLSESFKQRGYALKDMAGLYIASYWSDQTATASVPREVRSARADEARSRIADKERERQGKRRLVEVAQ